MDPLAANALYTAGILLIGLGVVGTVLPFLPGPLLIWCGALVWAWGNGFEQISWIELTVLGVLAALAWAADLWLTTLFSRRTGVSWRAILGAVVCGILGGFLLSGLPIIGTLFGALLGAVIGLFLIEYWLKRNACAGPGGGSRLRRRQPGVVYLRNRGGPADGGYLRLAGMVGMSPTIREEAAAPCGQ